MARDENGNSYGYAGRIARVNLTDKSVTLIPTSKYLPDYVGGRCMANKIFYDEARPGVAAFDPDNLMIYMTGPTCATGIPCGGRSLFTGISPNSFPEQYCWSGLGGFFSVELKWAGYDGLIIEGAASEPTYIYIEDDTIEFRSADWLWGKYVHESQLMLEDTHGHDVRSMVIGPAGENLVRNASITSNNDSAAAKAGFGAVWGSKKLKAIACKGSGSYRPGSIEKTLKLRKTMGMPEHRLKPLYHLTSYDIPAAANNHLEVPEGFGLGFVACSYGCNQHCNQLFTDVNDGFGMGRRQNRIEKCVGRYAFAYYDDANWMPAMSYWTKQNFFPSCKMMAMDFPVPDVTDPDIAELFGMRPGDTLGHWKPNWHKGNTMMDLCNQYGLDKWDTIVWIFPWLAMGSKEGVFEDMDVGMEIDCDNEEFIKHVLDMIVYRKGELGNTLAEGMARAIRKLGKEKFGNTIYQGRFSNMIQQNLPLRISNESAWGHSFHWQGRGFQGANDITQWLPITIELMTSTRDAQTVTHHKDFLEWRHAVKDDVWSNPLVPPSIIRNENAAELKDTVMACEFQTPDLLNTSLEAEMLEAATGDTWTREMTDELANRSKLLFRAILMKHSGRCREQEVTAVYPSIEMPDGEGKTVTWEQFNELVDGYYKARGWDLETGWPTRETWEKYGLSFVADDMEKEGKLPA
jgi:aldehyde:ferredoxin oxidoreductase